MRRIQTKTCHDPCGSRDPRQGVATGLSAVGCRPARGGVARAASCTLDWREARHRRRAPIPGRGSARRHELRRARHLTLSDRPRSRPHPCARPRRPTHCHDIRCPHAAGPYTHIQVMPSIRPRLCVRCAPQIVYATNHMLEVAYVTDKRRCSRLPTPQTCCGSSTSLDWVDSDGVAGHMLEIAYVMSEQRCSRWPPSARRLSVLTAADMAASDFTCFPVSA